ncbi:MAG: thioredoxin family protein [Patescibacteria group bacterium]
MINKYKFLFIGILLILLTIPFFSVYAADDGKINIYFFHGQGCPHCAEERIYLQKLQKDNPDLDVFEYEVWYNKENQALFSDFAKTFGTDANSVPKLFIGNDVVEGYLSEISTGLDIERKINQYTPKNYPDPLEKVQNKEPESPDEGIDKDIINNLQDKIIDYPIIGQINLSAISLPVLTILLGLLDGFNPCAMWVLLFLIGLLLNTKDRKRMWLIGGVFLITSAVVYYLFMAAWLNVFIFVGFLLITRIIIGIIAIVAGVIHIKDFFKYKKGECKVEDAKTKLKISERARQIVNSKKALPVTLLGIIALAFSVNLIELLCSAGLPAIYTSILTANNLSAPVYYIYLAIYIVFFMIDDFIVFLIAMFTLKMAGFTGKFSRWSNLIGGIIILLIGLLFIFKYDLLVF